jgi:hypothetical protein
VRDAGEAWVDPRRVNPEGWVHPQYRWLADQMRRRIEGGRGGLPWFAYCTRPDLRWVRHSRPAGETNVLIEFVPPARQFVAFPCWAWHEVFGGQYLAFNGAERREWDRRERQALGRSYWEHEGRLPTPLQAELEASWLRLFSPTLPARAWRRGDRRDDREAVVEVIRVGWVRRVQEFIGTGAWLCCRLRRRT